MKKTIAYIIIVFILVACESTPTINDKSKRNGKWCWITKKDNTAGRWVKIGEKTTVEEGLFKLFNCEGLLHSSGTITDYKTSDTTYYYDPEGKIVKKEFRDQNDVIRWKFMDGKLMFKYPTCEIESRGEYQNGLLVDEHIGYYKDGEKKYHFVRQPDSSVFMQFYESKGLLIEERKEKNGNYHGLGKAWYKNGNIKMMLNYRDGKLNGEARYFHENGNLDLICCYSNEVLQDTFKVYFEDGGLSELGFFKNGKEHGKYLGYHPNGQIYLDYNYYEGKMHGEQLGYSQNGELIRRAKYEYGEQVDFEEFN